MSFPINIIGTGLAGYTLARELRKLSRDLPLRLISSDAGDFYSKPMLSNGFSANKTAEQLVMKPAARMAEELNAEILPHTRVLSLDKAARLIKTDKGDLPYGHLVLAMGADPFPVGIQGAEAGDVLHVNDIADYAHFRAQLAGKKRVIIIGSGLIGCEFANDLVTAGFQVKVLDLAKWPLSRMLPEAPARFLQARLEALGVKFRMEVAPVHLYHTEGGVSLSLSDGSAVDGDIVLSAIGLRPRIALAEAAGLTVRRGIVVDRFLRGSDANVYALGDCAEVEGHVLPFVMPIMQAARALAATLAGTPTPLVYPAMPVVVKTPACPAAVCPPAPGRIGEWHIEQNESGVTARFQAPEGELLGFALLGDAASQRQRFAAQIPALIA